MKELLEDILYTLNKLPNRKVVGKEFTTYELAKRIEVELEFASRYLNIESVNKTEDE